jgi:predicted secreted protein
MKKIILALAMVALAASLAFAANRNFGYLDEAAGTTDQTISWTGAAAHNISVYAASADLDFTLNPISGDDTTVTVKAGTTVTLDGLEFFGFTIDRTSSTAYEVIWW